MCTVVVKLWISRQVFRRVHMFKLSVGEMKLVDRCPNFCLSARPEIGDDSTGSARRNLVDKSFWRKISQILNFNCKTHSNDNSTRDFHPKLAASNVHKYRIERKHKIKKRELFNQHRQKSSVADDYNKSHPGKAKKKQHSAFFEKHRKLIVVWNCRVQRWESLVNFPVKWLLQHSLRPRLSRSHCITWKYQISYTNNSTQFSVLDWIAILIFHLTELIKSWSGNSLRAWISFIERRVKLIWLSNQIFVIAESLRLYIATH